MSGFSCVCVLPSSNEKENGEHTVHRMSDASTAISVCGSQELQHRCPEWDGSQRQIIHVHFIVNAVQLKAGMAFSYGDSRTVGLTTETDCETVRVVGTHDQERDYVESEDDADVRERRNYFIFSEIFRNESSNAVFSAFIFDALLVEYLTIGMGLRYIKKIPH